MKQLQKKVGFLVIPNQASKTILEITFIDQFIEKANPKADLITTVSWSPVAVVDETQRDHVLTFESLENKWKPERVAAK